MAILDSDVNVMKFIRNHQVTESLCKLYLNDDMADVHFVFGANSDNVQRLCSHRVILAAASPVFHQMFFGELRETGDVIISDCSFDAFSEFLQYFYVADVVLTSDLVFEVIQMAHKYDLPECVNMCVDFLIEYLTHDTIFITLQIAIWYDLTDLMAICTRMICDEAKLVFAAESFPFCTFVVLKRILLMNGLDCTEMDLLDAAMLWARHACFSQTDHTPTIEQCKMKLGESFESIRFNTMTAGEFSACLSRYPGMFNKQQLEQLFIEITTNSLVNSPGIRLKNARSKNALDEDGFIVCSRIASRRSNLQLIHPEQVVRFSVNQDILLHRIGIAKQSYIPEFPQKDRMPYVGNLLRVSTLSTQSISINLNKENQITLQTPAYLHADQIYEIELKLTTKSVHFSGVELKKDPIKIGNSIQFTFLDSPDVDYDNVTRGLITELHFQIPAERRPPPMSEPMPDTHGLPHAPPYASQPSTSQSRSRPSLSRFAQPQPNPFAQPQADPGVRVRQLNHTSNIRYHTGRRLRSIIFP